MIRVIRVNIGGPSDRSSIFDNRAESRLCALAHEQPFPNLPRMRRYS
jgi:hypothetical protein